MKNYIKANDQYGHRIGLNFNKNGQEYKSFLGGFVTTVINSAIFAFTLYKTYHMVNHHYNDVGSREIIRDQIMER
jgi:hypothetical protein